MAKVKRYHYITPEDYIEAAKLGISRKTLNDRVRRYNLDVDTAITQPLKARTDFESTWQKWKEICEKHGISRKVFYHRIQVYKYNEHKAATKEVVRGGYRQRRVVECNG